MPEFRLSSDSLRTVEVGVFHDERGWDNKAAWSYHGYAIVERRHWSDLCETLKRIREISGYPKAVHFTDLKMHSTGHDKTALAAAWARGLDSELLKHMRFFMLGIDMQQIDHSRFGGSESTKAERKMRMYNRFYEMGLFSALRWFFSGHDSITVGRLFSEERTIPSNDPFPEYAPLRFARHRESNIVFEDGVVKMIKGKEIPECPKAAMVTEMIQLVDVIIGGWSHLLDDSNTKTGCCEVAELMLPRARKMIDSPFNAQSKAYKRLAMRFFPRRPLPLDGLDSESLIQGEMYERRELRYCQRNQLDLGI